MHSVSMRLQNTFGFFTSVAFCTAILTALSVLLIPQNPAATIDPELQSIRVTKGRPHYYSSKKEEYAHVRFDIDADFSSLFNWNTKQLFVWVAVVYPPADAASVTPPSQAIIWDTIIKSESQEHPFNPFNSLGKEATKPKPKSSRGASKIIEGLATPGRLRVKNAKPKYQITDVSGMLSGKRNVTLEVGWNVQPWVGLLTWTMPQGATFGKWEGLSGGTSGAFDLPVIKGKAASQTSVVSSKGSPEVAGASPVI